jgi:uncharacterized protein (DUF983 family)
VKYLYCPRCKELRVKPWYSLRDRCARCRDDVRVINIPRTISTYAVYVLTAAAFAAVYTYTRLDDRFYLWVGLALVVAMMVIQFKDLSRGEKYARAKIRVTHSDQDLMKKKGWM